MATYDRDWTIRSKCRTTTDVKLYESDNRGGRQQDRLEQACGGCPVTRECASYALAFPDAIGGMIWAGVPVPQSPTTIFYERAIQRLQQISDGEDGNAG
ncbi:WhiB family transcriptional regulator [Nocardia asteroides]|uniref:WhiB family transcriptional regulator n=1 Tax=Nocardia asteroides TaxID=1824 RepID=UPI0037C5EBA8